MAQRNTWLRPEKGNKTAILLLLWIAQHMGYRITALFCWPATLYYALMYPTVRRASWSYLTHLHNAGKLPHKHWGMVLSHINAYSRNILDRIYLLGGRFPHDHIHSDGRQFLLDALKQGKGCILMGAHIGSFDALRHFGLTSKFRFRMLMYRHFLGPTSYFMEKLAPDFKADLIELGQADSMLTVSKALKNGDIVGILADRAHDNSRSYPVTFLGQEALLPAGPFQLAALTGAPIIVASAIRQKNGTYHITCRPLLHMAAEKPQLSSESGNLPQQMRAYARWMETLCQASPYAWFNFFDFWEEGL